MQIIFLHPKGTKNLKFSSLHLFLVGCIIFLSGSLLAWFAKPLLEKFGQQPIASPSMHQYISEPSLSVIVNRLGQLQARIEQLDSLSTRLGQALGIKSDLRNIEPTFPDALLSPASLNIQALTPALNTITQRIYLQQAIFHKIETILATRQLQALSWPTQIPVIDALSTSGFGWRNDPFTGTRTFHEGIDLAAPAGSAILAAAPGKIVFSGINSNYGLMAEIDHGQGIKTRYAHAQSFFVRSGDLVRAGQQIGLVGNSGRSTGSHLHFEIRIHGIAQNPQKFLGESSMHLLARIN